MSHPPRTDDLFCQPVWHLGAGGGGWMVLTRDGYPVAQGSESTIRLNPNYEKVRR